MFIYLFMHICFSNVVMFFNFHHTLKTFFLFLVILQLILTVILFKLYLDLCLFIAPQVSEIQLFLQYFIYILLQILMQLVKKKTYQPGKMHQKKGLLCKRSDKIFFFSLVYNGANIEKSSFPTKCLMTKFSLEKKSLGLFYLFNFKYLEILRSIIYVIIVLVY